MESGLIQMNAHLVMTEDATAMMFCGAFFAIIAWLLALAVYKDYGWKKSAIFAGIAVIGVIFFLVGVNKPRVKEIKSCASGPVSLEMVATQYRIIKVDGKELTLRER